MYRIFCARGQQCRSHRCRSVATTPSTRSSQPRPSKTPKFAYLITFVVSTLPAYWWGAAARPLGAARESERSTAVVRIRDAAAIVPELDVNTVRQKALAENIDRAAQIPTWPPRGGTSDVASQAEPAARLRDKLVVGVSREEAPMPCGFRLHIRTRIPARPPAGSTPWPTPSPTDIGRNGTSRRNRRIATRKRPPAGRPTTSPGDEAAGRRRQLAIAAIAAAADAGDALAPTPSLVDNPAWLDLQRQLADLQQRRARLLVDRTPIHPEVQQTEIRIADLQRQLEATERLFPAAASARIAPALLRPRTCNLRRRRPRPPHR